ncbi:outer membrane beta-barrel protein [Aureibacter tunicatorum]|uniref:Opacity protein-like surface antigen n=1 Tax=Aureibacter tunicatorum TaxID=866807 RepID=A0AAE3XKW6_9BACT|nr:outer membrane beta-barrel protein [Aureibacter tunicatorum]MDR6238488.1 opacity protein-like surface antigen [Aureibacter tunicatorum]BDD05579.1 hypothetical protein AUTU_30620 [Aureibacter tunicatorum]
MKQLTKFALIICVFIGLADNSKAQAIEKGKIMIGGSSNIRFKSEKSTEVFIVDGNKVSYDDDDDKNFNINIGAGYTVIDNLIIGLDISYLYSNLNGMFFINSGDDIQRIKMNNKLTGLDFNMFSKYYFTEQKFKPYAQIGAGYSLSRQYSGDFEQKYNGINLVGGAGAAYFITPSISVELGLNYQYTMLKNQDDADHKKKIKEIDAVVGLCFFL